ncbi:hypothetical protein EV189_2883 [Motilibacter rhizosphaerae]|uniref:Uncharacterized protein n=1 Tax=Motilibacter rhizosphaerae TaxID=598652 RepID=A0A4Q7NQF9_9ACTN|nr:hypothetical protein [Motilibacter rhizosphaerae]RZS87453.1 hypothetical protein EV189_2883 [Motilibacter rhizosphaerae]
MPIRPLPLLAAAGWTAEALLVLRYPQGDSGWGAPGRLVELAFVVALVGSATCLPDVRDRLRVRAAGRAATVVALVGLAALVVASVVSLVAGGNTLGLVFVVGLGLVLLSLLVLALDGLTAPGPRWPAPLPLLGLVVAIGLGDHGGGLLLGILFLGWAVRAVRSRTRATSPVTVAG